MFGEPTRTNSSCSFAQIACGRDFSVVVTTGGHAYSWGNGESGQLGHQENKAKKVPKKMSALRELEIPVGVGQAISLLCQEHIINMFLLLFSCCMNIVACGGDYAVMISKEAEREDQFNTMRAGVMMSMPQTSPVCVNVRDLPFLLMDSVTHSASYDVQLENCAITEPNEFLLGHDVHLLAVGKAHAVAATSG